MGEVGGMTVRLGLFGISAVALALGCGLARAETRALVVGVSGYPNLPAEIRLVGPKNDAREVANTLVRLGVPASDVTVLADGVQNLESGVSNPGPGTRQAVLDALDRLAEASKAGDTVVFYFSGHGSQQPDLDGDEEGGDDEVFLPYDVGKWEADGIENALVDDELNVRVQKILDKGADFFGIIDACHSATGFRSVAGDDARVRGIDPSLLGVPEDRPGGERALFLERKAPPKGKGRAAFFYAAQETEEALEKSPPNATDGESYGVFTYTMLARLARTPDITYRTLHQAVVADIKRNTLMTTQTPDLEGDLLDQPVLGLGQARTRRQWPFFNGTLQAGQLAGVENGAILALYDDPTAPADKALAYGVVENAGASKSAVTQVAWPCGGELSADGTCPTPLDVAAYRKGRFARVVEPGVDLSLVLSEPVRVDQNDGEDYAAPLAALKAAVAAPALAKRISLSATGYDVAVALVDGKLAFSATGGQVDAGGPGSSPRLTLPEDPKAAAATVESAISRIARALALQRLGGGDGVTALGLEPQVMIARAKDAAIEGDACSDDKADYEAPVDAGAAPKLAGCDIISVTLRNKGRKPADVTVLLVAQDFSVTALWPSPDTVNRIHPGEEKTAEIAQMEPHPATASEERLVFVAVPGLGKAHTTFDNLEQEGLRAVPGEDVAPGVQAARDLLSTGLNDMGKRAVAKPVRVEEEMSIEVRPFTALKDG
jgi:hypothetical protein